MIVYGIYNSNLIYNNEIDIFIWREINK